MKNYYVLDLEWNQSVLGIRNNNGSLLKNEIIQAGIVKLEDGRITDQLLVNVWPSALGFVSKKIEKLTNLSYQMLRKERNFPFAWNMICDFIGDFEDAVIFTWDTADLDVLRENCEYWESPHDFSKSTYIDLQVCIGKKCFPECTRRMSVSAVMEHFGITSDGRAHNALTDALNEGKIFLEAFESAEEACDFYERDYFNNLNAEIVVEPFAVIDGSEKIKNALNQKEISIYLGGKPEKLLYPRFTHNKKRVMLWEENDEIFMEECKVEKNRFFCNKETQYMTCYIKKLQREDLECIEHRYQKYLKKKAKTEAWIQEKMRAI